MLVHRLYVTDTPVRLSRETCVGLVSGSRAILLLDDIPADPAFARSLAAELPGCDLVFAGQRPVLGDRGSTHPLAGLSADAARDLLARKLGRPVFDHELPGVRRLVAAVAGSPLQLGQAAALEREDPRLTFDHLAEIAERDAGALDRRSLGRMSDGERRALAVLTVAAGAQLPSAVIGGMGDIAYAAQFLTTLHGRGLVEGSDDRFGLPVCRAEGYRQTLLRYIQLASAVRGLCDWLGSLDPAGPEAGAGVESAVSLLGVLAEQREWGLVVRLVRVAEPVLFAWGRWEAWRDVLDQGIEAAGWVRDTASEAYFTHQKGTLEYGEGRPEEAYRLLNRALELRRTAGDAAGAELTRHNLGIITPPPGAGGHGNGPVRRGVRRILTYAAAAVAVVALVAGAQQALGGLLSGDEPDDVPTSTPPVGSDSSGGEGTPATTSGTTSSAGGTESTGTGPSTGASTGTNTGSSTGTSTGTNTGSSTGTSNGTVGPNLTPAAGISPTATTIADTRVGSQGRSGPITVTNTGGGSLVIGTPGITGTDAADFTVSRTCDNVSLAAGNQCTLTVTFAPQAVGAKSATLEIPHSASGKPARLTLRATAVGLPDLTVLTEPDVRLSGETAQLFIKVDNIGDGDAVGSTLDVTMGDGPPTPLSVDPIPALDYNEVPYDIPEGCYDTRREQLLCSYTVALDPLNTLIESNDGNNEFASGTGDG
ncbi:choice-of-anchor D domain-containing protein [Streptomyces sp. NPDC002156]